MLRLRELRLEQGLTQKELAEKVKSTSKNIWAYENNVAIPPLDVLSRMSDFFDCSIDFLVGRTDDFGNIFMHTSLPIHLALSAEEKELIKIYRSLNTKNRLYVITYAEIRLEEQGDSI